MKHEKATSKEISWMIIALIILCSLLFTPACTAISHIEDSHDILWNVTKALKVIDKDGNKYLLQSFSNPRRTYIYKTQSLIGDTLILTDSIRASLIIKRYDN